VYGLLPSSTPAQLSLTPGNLNFGTVAIGQSNTRNFQLVNTGGLSLTGTVSTASPFKISSGNPFSLSSGQTGLVQVSFSPVSGGSFSNVVIFISDGGNSTNALVGTAAVVPVADFTAVPTSGTWPLVVAFTDNSTGTITNRSWDFGDSGTTNTTLTALSHTYVGSGTNTVRLTASGPVGTNTLARPNYIIVTNVGPFSVTIQPSGKQLQLTWPAGTLQSAALVNGPYTNVLTAVSPYTITPSNTAQFFRIKVQ
jgi:PKD repeat protein